MATAGAEHAAPGEEQVVFSRTAGVVASKVSYMDVLDPANAWHVLGNPHEDEAPPLTCQFNHRGTHLAVGDESGRIDLWSFVPIRIFVKSLELTRGLLDKVLASASLADSTHGKSWGVIEESGIRTREEKEKEREDADHGWSTASVAWSRCSRYILAAYVQKRKTWPNGEAVQLPGLVAYWNVVDRQVEGYLRLPTRVMHVSLSPRNPRRGSVCCANGTSFIADFISPPPAAVTSSTSHDVAAGVGIRFLQENQKGQRLKEEGSRAGGDSSSEAFLGAGKVDMGLSSGSQLDSVDDGDRAVDFGDAVGDGISANKHIPHKHPPESCEKMLATEKPTLGNALVARLRKIWDPVVQMELFQTTMGTAASTAVESRVPFEFDLDNALVRKTAGGSLGDGGVSSASRGWEPGHVASAGGSGGGGPRIAGGSGGSKPPTKMPVQAGRVAWCEDGNTIFLLTHEGNLLKVEVQCDGSLALLARVDLQGGASPSTLQLSGEGDKVLIATATRGLCLMPTDDLDISRAEFFGENFGTRGTKARFWGAATLGNVHGRGHDGSRKLRLTVVGNPSRTRDDKTDLFFFGTEGGQPQRVDTPRREGVISLTCSPQRPLLLFLCPTGEIYYREEVLKTDFPGPWYPSGYVLIDNNVDYLEAENQLDTVVMTGPEGEVLSKTQAHEVVVPWQHQAVAAGEASAGAKEEAVDLDGHGDTELWAGTHEEELRWIPETEDIPLSEGRNEKGPGGTRGSPRGGGPESPGGPWARLLGATPTLLKEARKRLRAPGFSDKHSADKRRKMVPKMLQDLTAKKKKYDEEAVKRRRKQEETRAKTKRNRDKKAAAEAEKVAERARSAAEQTARRGHGTQNGDSIGEPVETATGTHSGAGLHEPMVQAENPCDVVMVPGPQLCASAALTAASSCTPSLAGADVYHRSSGSGGGLVSFDYDGPSSMSGAAADAAAWLAAAPSGQKESIHGTSMPLSAQPSRRSSGLPPRAQHDSRAHFASKADTPTCAEGLAHPPRGLVPEETLSADSSAGAATFAATEEDHAVTDGTTSTSVAVRSIGGGVATCKGQSPGNIGEPTHPGIHVQFSEVGTSQSRQLSHSSSDTHGGVDRYEDRLAPVTTDLSASGVGAGLPLPRRREGALPPTPSSHASCSSRLSSSPSMQAPSSSHPPPYHLACASPSSFARSEGLHDEQQQTRGGGSILSRTFAQDKPQPSSDTSMAATLGLGLHPSARAHNRQGKANQAAEMGSFGKMAKRDDEGSSALRVHDSGPGDAEKGGVRIGVELPLADVVLRQQNGKRENPGEP